jgi:hypothetical protein
MSRQINSRLSMIRAYLIEEQKDRSKKKKYISSNNIYDHLSSIIILDRSFERDESMNSICTIAHTTETLDYNQYIHTMSDKICAFFFACSIMG